MINFSQLPVTELIGKKAKLPFKRMPKPVHHPIHIDWPNNDILTVKIISAENDILHAILIDDPVFCENINQYDHIELEKHEILQLITEEPQQIKQFKYHITFGNMPLCRLLELTATENFEDPLRNTIFETQVQLNCCNCTTKTDAQKLLIRLKNIIAPIDKELANILKITKNQCNHISQM